MSEQEHYLKILENKKGIIGRSKDVSYFKRLIKAMYKGFPNSRVSEKAVKSIIVTEEDLKSLVKNGFLLEEKVDGGYQYNLAPNSLILISSWNVEKLTKIILVFGIITSVLLIYQTFF